MESLTSIVDLAVSLISLAAVTVGLKLLNDYKSKVQPRLDNEEYLMERAVLTAVIARIILMAMGWKCMWSRMTRLAG